MNRSKFWRRHPVLELLFFIAWVVVWFTIIVAAVCAGGFHGRLGGGLTIANDPARFWTTIAILSVIGIASPAYNLRRIIRTLRTRQWPEDSDSLSTQL